MHSAVLIEPMFGIVPESLNAVNMISALRSSVFFFNDNMISPETQRTVSVPIVSVVEALPARYVFG